MATRNKYRDFQLLEFFEEKLFIEDAWCEVCKTTDIGLFGPNDYQVLGKKFIKGVCRYCGSKVVSEVVEKNVI